MKYGGPVFPFQFTNGKRENKTGFFGTDPLAPGEFVQFAGMTVLQYIAIHCGEEDLQATYSEMSIKGLNKECESHLERRMAARLYYAEQMLKVID